MINEMISEINDYSGSVTIIGCISWDLIDSFERLLKILYKICYILDTYGKP